MLQRNRITVFIGLPFVLSACWGVSGNGERERETRDHSDFVAIENHGELDVQVRQAEEFRVVVSIDENLLDNVKTHVRGDTLIIDNNINLVDIVSGPHVIVEMPQLTSAQLSGSGDLDASAFDASETVRFELNSSADLRFEGSAPRIEATLDGSGDLLLIGATDFLDVETNGSGNVDARDLDSAAGRLQSDGSGDVSATINGETDAEANGSGDIDLYGDVDLRNSDENGSGDIRVH